MLVYDRKNEREVSRLPLSFKYTIIYKTTIVSWNVFTLQIYKSVLE